MRHMKYEAKQDWTWPVTVEMRCDAVYRREGVECCIVVSQLNGSSSREEVLSTHTTGCRGCKQVK